MNPARSLAPAYIWGCYKDLWIYIVAPVVGALTGPEQIRIKADEYGANGATDSRRQEPAKTMLKKSSLAGDQSPNNGKRGRKKIPANKSRHRSLSESFRDRKERERAENFNNWGFWKEIDPGMEFNVLALLVKEDPHGVCLESGDPRTTGITLGVSSIHVE
ncbi:hypothetical protein Bca101_072297 [Brassica carinata]